MAIIKPNGTLSGRVGELVYQYQKGMLTVRQSPASLYIQILLLPLHSLTTSRKWNKADASFVIRQCDMFCPHSLTSESGQFIGL